jgi:hypothetical protein
VFEKAKTDKTEVYKTAIDPIMMLSHVWCKWSDLIKPSNCSTKSTFFVKRIWFRIRLFSLQQLQAINFIIRLSDHNSK